MIGRVTRRPKCAVVVAVVVAVALLAPSLTATLIVEDMIGG